MASVTPIRRRVPAGSVLSLPYGYAQIGLLLIAGYTLMIGIVAQGLIGWAVWSAVPALVGMAVATGPAGGWWTERRSRARRSGPRSWVAHEPARVIREPAPVIREPESGWWEAHPDPSPTSMTVAVVSESETHWGAEDLVSRLAELAVHDELVVVYGSQHRSRSGHHAVVSGLQDHLPRHHVVEVHVAHRGYAVRIAQHGERLGHEDTAMLGQFVENGSLPIVVTSESAIHDVAAELSSSLRADRVMRVYRSTHGVDLLQVWHRQQAVSAN